jgi:uncharacterized membrane protein YkvA (DUF1232 family)
MARSRTRSRTRRARSGALLGRGLALAAFLPVASRAPMYARLIWTLLGDRRVPLSRKVLLAGAAGYLLVGRDIIPDSLPVVGGLDDLVVVVLAVELFLDGIPSELLHEKLDELGLDAAAYDRDIAQFRRLMPRPIRRAVQQVPRLIDTAADLAAQAGVGPRLRGLISKEGSLA